jgi:hypothetical protein
MKLKDLFYKQHTIYKEEEYVFFVGFNKEHIYLYLRAVVTINDKYCSEYFLIKDGISLLRYKDVPFSITEEFWNVWNKICLDI